MAMAKARAPKVILRPRACFELGQRVTEVAAALAYADFLGRRDRGLEGVRSLAAGMKTATLAADRLAKDAPHGANLGAGRLKKDIDSFYERIRSNWVEKTPKPLTPGDLAELQNRTSELRKRVLVLWHVARLTCPNGLTPKKRKKGK